MADNVTLDSMSGGDTCAADDIAGVKHQRVKISLGADGAATDALGGAGAVAAGVQRVTLASDDPAVALLTTIDADTGLLSGLILGTQADDVANTADGLQVTAFGYCFDGTTWDRMRGDSTDGLLVNLGANNDVAVTGSVTANAGTNLNTSLLALEAGGNLAGAATSLALIDDIIYTDDTSTHATGTSKGALIMAAAAPTDAAVNANDIGAVAMTTDRKLHVSVQDALPAGTAAIGKLAANSGVDIGDVDVTSIAAGDNLIGRVKLSDGTDVADILDLANSNPLTVAIVDGSGNQITSFGGGTQYTEDDAAAANPVGTALNLIRADTLSGLTTADGDNVAARGTDKGELYVKHADNITVNSHAVTNAGTFAVQVDGAALTALQLIDDPVATLGTSTYTETTTKGMIAGALRRDADTSAVNTDNEIAPLLVDANGYLKVEIFDGGGSHTVDNAGTFAVQDSAAETSLAILDDWDESDRAKVNPIVGVAGVAAGAGAVGTTTQRMTLASDDPSVILPRSSASVTSTASAATSAQLLASTSGRKGLLLFNTDANGAYVKYGTTASATDFTVRIPADGYWEMPLPIYTGRIDVIWAADGSGAMLATELT